MQEASNNSDQSEAILENQTIAIQFRNNLVDAFNKLEEDHLDRSSREENIFVECLHAMHEKRKEIENKLISQLNLEPVSSTSLPQVDPNDINRLLGLIDEYDRTVEKFVYPYQRDPNMLNFKLHGSIPNLLHLSIREEKVPSELNRNKIREAAREFQNSAGLLHRAQTRLVTLTPKSRFGQLLDELGIEHQLLNQQEIALADVENLEHELSQLTDYELNKIWDSLTEHSNQTKSRKHLIENIFTITGLTEITESRNAVEQKSSIDTLASDWPTWMTEVLDRRTNKPDVDLGIVIALEEEFRELAPQMRAKAYYNSEVKQYYYMFERRRSGHTDLPYRCVATFMGSMGPVDAAIVSDRLLAQFNPKLIVSIGIAGSMDKEVLVGNVVVADQTDEYLASSKAITSQRKTDWDIQFSGNPLKSDASFVAHAMNLKYAQHDILQNWQNTGINNLEGWIGRDSILELIQNGLIEEKPEIHTGHIASGPIVGAAIQFVKWLKEKHDRKLLALEMESVGVLTASHKRAVRSLIIRGISDYSDERKLSLDAIGKGSLRRYAMGNALNLLWILLDMQ